MRTPRLRDFVPSWTEAAAEADSLWGNEHGADRSHLTSGRWRLCVCSSSVSAARRRIKEGHFPEETFVSIQIHLSLLIGFISQLCAFSSLKCFEHTELTCTMKEPSLKG